MIAEVTVYGQKYFVHRYAIDIKMQKYDYFFKNRVIPVKTTQKSQGVTTLAFIGMLCKAPYSCSAGASLAAGASIVAAGASAAGTLGSVASTCELTSLFGVPSLLPLGRVMLEIRQSTTNTPAIVQVAFSRKSVV